MHLKKKKKMKIRFYSLILLCLLMFSPSLARASVSSIMIDAESGSILYDDNADTLRYPASLTKLMTLYITFDALEKGKLSLDDELKISYTAANRSPSRLGLTPGKTIDVRTAVLATIIKSANDCASVLSEALAKDEREFARLMTETAHKLGMKNTTFKNASGLPNRAQKTTARDMAILASALYHHFPQYYAWFSIQSFEFEGKTISSHNPILKDFAGADGLKTGYTAAAGFNIVTSAKRGNHRVIAVTMGHKQAKERDQKVYAMMDKALTQMEHSNKVNPKTLKTEINRSVKPLPQAKKVQKKTNSLAQNWVIQMGAFNTYQAALNLAQKNQKKLSAKISAGKIYIEKSNSARGYIYRAELAGLSRTNAQRACSILKKQNQSCLIKQALKAKTYAQR